MEMPPANFSPYSRANWTELQLQFRPPRDGASISTHLRDYARPEEIDIVVTALQLRWRELSARARDANRTATSRMSAAAFDQVIRITCFVFRTQASSRSGVPVRGGPHRGQAAS
jgi:hypothetical protein